MQIAINLPDRLVRAFKQKYRISQQKKILEEAIKRELYSENKDSLWNIPKIAEEIKGKDNNNRENHDKYLYGELMERKSCR